MLDMNFVLRQDTAPAPDDGCDVNDENASAAVVRILLIDDDPAYLHLCQRYLSRQTSQKYEVVAVSTAAAAFETFSEQEFDCLLIDYALPDLSGTQVIRTLQETLTDSPPPTIILTAGGGEAAAAEAVRAGASDFLSKRLVSSASLVRAINNAVEKGRLKTSIEARSSELQSANEQLKQKNEEIQRFYQSVSHEVKTPLAAAREFIAITLDGVAGPVTEKQKETLSHALDSCDQITAHFNDLIEMTRLDAAKIPLKKQVGSLESVVTRSLAAISSAVEAKSIYLRRQIASPLPLVLIDGNRVIQVLSNLLANAIKYTEPNGTITLSVTHAVDDGCVEIAVADTGCGITEDDLPHVFDRLYQVEHGGDELMGAGLGLGLSIAKEIVELHGGRIWAESTFRKGSRFVFQLPVARSIYDESEEAE